MSSCSTSFLVEAELCNFNQFFQTPITTQPECKITFKTETTYKLSKWLSQIVSTFSLSLLSCCLHENTKVLKYSNLNLLTISFTQHANWKVTWKQNENPYFTLSLQKASYNQILIFISKLVTINISTKFQTGCLKIINYN